MIFFIADLHLGHLNKHGGIIAFCKRPFTSIPEMDTEIIKRWNETIGPEDVVYVLGDFAYRNKIPIKVYAQQLNGHKHLIRGNHDKHSDQTYLDAGFESVQEVLYLTYENQEIVLFHYPILSWKHRGKGAWHLYGHMHERIEELMEKRKAYNVGVDTNGFRPISFEQLKPIMILRDAKTQENSIRSDTTQTST